MGEIRKYPNGRPNQMQAERYGNLTRAGEWYRVAKLARDIKRARKVAIRGKIIEDFIDNPRPTKYIAAKFNVSESTANYWIDHYTKAQYVPKMN